MNSSTVIKRLGGTVKTAKICGVSPPAVSQWKANGIPPLQERYLRLLRPDVFNVTDDIAPSQPATGEVA
ncbi:Cro/CI family transcriptional regulator [Robbsia andropogonis]|uniref:Cro/CI family transcriptional regulator n=1 Tax=Robbsia andropogonis TaxID=28092 RepID=UPI003D218797